jgi:hypothetical protein
MVLSLEDLADAGISARRAQNALMLALTPCGGKVTTEVRAGRIFFTERRPGRRRLDRRPFITGALTRFATLPNHQTVEIGPWVHGGRTHADPRRPFDPLDESEPAGPGARIAAWWSPSRDTSTRTRRRRRAAAG